MNESILQCEICKIFSNPYRLQILLALRSGKKSVSELVKKVGASQSSISQNLAFMRLRGVISANKEGPFIYYTLEYPEIMDAYDIMRSVTKKIGRR